jgi:hypothetical protein
MGTIPHWLEVSLVVLTQIILLAGLVGLIIPIFPGVTVMWLAILGYGIVTGFSTLGIVLFVLITLLMILGVSIDNILMGVGARTQGASWLSIVVALLAGVIGTILLPPFGGLLTAPLGVLLLEYWRVREWRKAGRALLGLTAGWGLSFVARFMIGLIMIALWWVWVWKG